MGKSAKFKIPKKVYKKTYLIFSSLATIALILFFVLLTMTTKTPGEMTNNVKFDFVPYTSNTPGVTDYKLTLSPQGNDISFVRVKLSFNFHEVQLQQYEVSTNDTIFEKVIYLTPLDEANETGLIEVVLASEKDGSKIMQNSVELATLTFEGLSGEESFLTIIDEETQVVNSNSLEVPFTTDKAKVSLGN